jgi:DNA (cytosine-5)-methyltransferase 1
MKMGKQISLEAAVKFLPTPRSTDGTKGSRTEEGSRRELERGKNVDLGMVVKLFPTPAATDGKGAGKTGSLGDRLDYAAERGATKSNEYGSPPPTGGQLNPTWVEWLMGFPLGWTALDASETQ